MEQADEMPRTIPLAHPVLFGKAGRIVYGRGTGIMMKGTEQHSARDEKRRAPTNHRAIDWRAERALPGASFRHDIFAHAARAA